MTERELEEHIADCGALMVAAYRRFILLGRACDRTEAVIWMEMRNAAMRARSPEKKAAMEAEALRRVEEGVCYFSSLYAQELGKGRAQ